MSKKRDRNHEDDEMDPEMEDGEENDSLDENPSQESDDSNDEDVSEDIEVMISDDDSSVDIIIEISDDEDEVIPTSDVLDTPTEDDVVLSKHKVLGKHALKYDSIFKGKKEEKTDDNDISGYFNEKFEVDKSSSFFIESHDGENYFRSKDLKEKVYKVLLEHTEINFLNNRRKPSKIDFNQYYHLLKVNLKEESFTNVEIFNELSVYFSDNLFNMFKLLDNKWKNLIIVELQDHIGKNANSKEISNRNIYVDTEIEFEHEDPTGEPRLYTGVVIETDYPSSTFVIDSFENIYEIHISCVTKILNNTKFKYNLNKLNNIDFL